MLYTPIVLLAWLVWHLGWRIRVIGRENLPKEGGYILAPNHISAIDPVFVAVARVPHRPMQVLAKEELFHVNAFCTWFFKSVNVVGIERGAGDTGTLEQIVARCRDGMPLLIFPEGTRTKDPDCKPGKLKSGAFVMASEAAVPVVPCRVIYDTPDGRMKLFCRMKVCFGAPIPAGKLTIPPENKGRALRADKQLLLDAWEQLYAENTTGKEQTTHEDTAC